MSSSWDSFTLPYTCSGLFLKKKDANKTSSLFTLSYCFIPRTRAWPHSMFLIPFLGRGVMLLLPLYLSQYSNHCCSLSWTRTTLKSYSSSMTNTRSVAQQQPPRSSMLSRRAYVGSFSSWCVLFFFVIHTHQRRCLLFGSVCFEHHK